MATDQEIRDAGFKYIPQQKYLQNPFQIPTTDDSDDGGGGGGGGGGGIPDTNAGSNFSVYNADPNTITNMNPNMNALQDARYGNELSYVGRTLPGDSKPLYSTNTAAMKNMEMYPGYYGLDQPPPSKISQLLKKGIGFIPGIGTLAQIGSFASGLLPVNRRAIMENQLGTQGVMVDDIGRIVVGPGGSYNTPEGIMAGYNANQMTGETFDKRTDTMRNTLDEKYGLSKEQIDGLIDGSLTDEEMEEINDKAYNKVTGRTSDIVTNIRNIAIAKNNFKGINDITDDIVDIKNDTKSNNDTNNDTNSTASTDTSENTQGGYSCFIAGTKVTMADGTLKNIEDVVVGDKVKGHKEENTVIKLDPTLLATRKLYSFNNNDHYFFTSEHPFMTEEGWKSIKPEKTKERDGVELYEQLKGELKVGDKLVTDKGLIEITNIESKKMNNPEMPLYNFNVSNDNSYIADGYVVHNKGGTSGTGGTTSGGTTSGGHGYQGSSGSHHYRKGGRAGYFYGGRVSVMKGGLASIL